MCLAIRWNARKVANRFCLAHDDSVHIGPSETHRTNSIQDVMNCLLFKNEKTYEFDWQSKAFENRKIECRNSRFSSLMGASMPFYGPFNFLLFLVLIFSVPFKNLSFLWGILTLQSQAFFYLIFFDRESSAKSMSTPAILVLLFDADQHWLKKSRFKENQCKCVGFHSSRAAL